MLREIDSFVDIVAATRTQVLGEGSLSLYVEKFEIDGESKARWSGNSRIDESRNSVVNPTTGAKYE